MSIDIQILILFLDLVKKQKSEIVNQKSEILMPLAIINSIASWFLKHRIHQIELFLKYPNEVQEELLMNLIRSSEETVYGKKHEYSSIKSYKTFA